MSGVADDDGLYSNLLTEPSSEAFEDNTKLSHSPLTHSNATLIPPHHPSMAALPMHVIPKASHAACWPHFARVQHLADVSFRLGLALQRVFTYGWLRWQV